jgi:coronin-1B/1C/6
MECEKVIHSSKKQYDSFYHDLVWNSTGSSYTISSRDQRILTTDARTGKISNSILQAHHGGKSIKLVSLPSDHNCQLLSVGFGPISQRQVKLWDLRNTTSEVYKLDIDSNPGMLMPFYDADCNLLYLSGKGDGNIRIYDVNSNNNSNNNNNNNSNIGLTFLSEFKSNLPTHGKTHFIYAYIYIYNINLIHFE